MTEPQLLIERQGSIALITLNDPATRNSLTPAMVGELTTFLASANADDGLACLVLTGAGAGFCSGGNVKDMLHGTDPMYTGSPEQMQEAYRTGIQRIPRLFHALDVPAIAAVNGAAIGAGCDLACMCDIRIASKDAKFAASFLRVGIVPGDGGAWLLPRLIGYSRAMEMALTCRMVEADEASAWGLVSTVVERDALLETALTMARTIARFPLRSIRLNKRLIRQSMNLTLDDCLEISAAYQAIAQHTADQKEAVAALLEKREPSFRGE